MNCFPDEIRLKDRGFLPTYSGRCFELEEPFRVYTSKGLVIVPQGFITDGASIPKVFQNIFSPFGKTFPCAIFHDWGYSKYNKRWTRKEIDDEFLTLMYNCNINWFQRHSIHTAVRLFGWKFYKGWRR